MNWKAGFTFLCLLQQNVFLKIIQMMIFVQHVWTEFTAEVFFLSLSCIRVAALITDSINNCAQTHVRTNY